MNHLDAILAQTRAEVAPLATPAALAALREQALAHPAPRFRFYERLAERRRAGQPLLIAEYKRRSPSNPAIGLAVGLAAQVERYAAADVAAISVLTNGPFFGGALEDLAAAHALVGYTGPPLLRKDFIVSPLQLYQARLAGAEAVLLIAAALTGPELAALLAETHALGMGALVEVHHPDELPQLAGLPVQVLGVNNRDLTDFSIRLCRTALVAAQVQGGVTLIAESGIDSALTYRAATARAHGALIGTALMQQPGLLTDLQQPQSTLCFKACGARAPEHLAAKADLVGVNFSPLSRRRVDPVRLAGADVPTNAIAVFYRNSMTEVESVLRQFPFRWVQRYADEVTPEALAQHPQRVLLAIPAGMDPLASAERFAYHTDLFLLDGAVPGSGVAGTAVPQDFHYPFLLAGGVNETNLHRALAHPYCVGVDIATGVETEGEFDPRQVVRIRAALAALSLPTT